MLSEWSSVSGSGFCYHSIMTIGITGPGRRVPWRGAVVVLIIAAIVLSICLILLAARVCRHQELDAAHALAERALRRSDLLDPWPHRVQRPTPVDVANSDRPRLGATRLLLRGEGLVLRSRPLSAALP